MTGDVVSIRQGGQLGGRNGDGNGNRLDARVSALEAEFKHVATKADIERLRSWILGGVILGMIVAAGLALGIARLFLYVPAQ